jgi:hypothetical protein
MTACARNREGIRPKPYFCTTFKIVMHKTGVFITTMLFLSISWATYGCGSSANGQDGNADDSLKTAEAARLKEIEALPRVAFHSYGTHFSFAKLDGLKSVHRDSVPWGYMMPQSEMNGQVMYYFFPGYALELASPQIRIEYMSKSLKGCGSIDSILTWLKGLYIGSERNGKLVGERKVGTVGGDELTLLEISVEEFKRDTIALASKQMGWAYADQGDMILGITYSAVKPEDYNQGYALFKDLVMSYKKEDAAQSAQPAPNANTPPMGETQQGKPQQPRNIAVPAGTQK